MATTFVMKALDKIIFKPEKNKPNHHDVYEVLNKKNNKRSNLILN